MADGDIPCCRTTFWLYILVIVGLVAFAGLMAGLTLGLMSLGLVDLEVLIKSGRPQDRIHASKIFPLVKNQHLLLCTLLIGNSLAMEALPIFLDKLVPPWMAVLVSVSLILMFGEILPQAICTRYGLVVGATVVPFVRVLLMVFYPIAYPISKVLDCMLGKEHAALLRRAELKTFVTFHGNEAGKGGNLTHDETTIITGALELTEKTVKDAMTPISKAFSLDLDATLNLETLNAIMAMGHSRVPIYCQNPENIIGLVLVKNLLGVDPNDEVPLRKMLIRKIPRVSGNMPLYDMLNEFQKGHSHIAVVYKDMNQNRGRKRETGHALQLDGFMPLNASMLAEALGLCDGHDKSYSLCEIQERTQLNLCFVCRSKCSSPEHEAEDSIAVEPSWRETQDASVTLSRVDGGQQLKKGPLAPAFRKRHRGCAFCILDVENAPIPEFPPNEVVVGVITMEDVFEELLKEEILDETDEYVNIHNRIKVNMNASHEKLPSINLLQQSMNNSSATATSSTMTTLSGLESSASGGSPAAAIRGSEEDISRSG